MVKPCWDFFTHPETRFTIESSLVAWGATPSWSMSTCRGGTHRLAGISLAGRRRETHRDPHIQYWFNSICPKIILKKCVASKVYFTQHANGLSSSPIIKPFLSLIRSPFAVWYMMTSKTPSFRGILAASPPELCKNLVVPTSDRTQNQSNIRINHSKTWNLENKQTILGNSNPWRFMISINYPDLWNLDPGNPRWVVWVAERVVAERCFVEFNKVGWINSENIFLGGSWICW